MAAKSQAAADGRHGGPRARSTGSRSAPAPSRGTKYFLFRNVPRDISWVHTLGSATLTAFIVQALTGVILAMYYKPSSAIDP